MAGNIDPRTITWEARLPAEEPSDQIKRDMNTYQKIAVVVIDILLLAAVAVAIGMANQHPDQFTPLFFKIFFSLAIPVVIGGIFSIQRLASMRQTPP